MSGAKKASHGAMSYFMAFLTMGLRQELVEELDVYRGFITLIFNSVGEEHPLAPLAPTNQFQQKFKDSLKSINFD